MDKSKIKLLAFDLDGTLSQHKTPLDDETIDILSELSNRYKLLMSGAGMCRRIFNQMRQFPIDILGNYGMQYARYNYQLGDIEIFRDISIPCDRESCEERVTYLRNKYGYTSYKGDNVEYHSSGCITFPLLGTLADLQSKLSFDPDRAKRRAIYQDVVKVFDDFNVFIGGSSSFDMAPRPYDKYYALSNYCIEHGFLHEEVAYFGDDYGLGGNDESVYLSDMNFIKVDDYTQFKEKAKPLL